MLEYNVNLNHKSILVTGAAGFIGCNLVKRLMADFPESKIVGIDSITDYYDVNLKYSRIDELNAKCLEMPNSDAFVFIKGNIADKATIEELFTKYKPQVVVNLAA